MAIKSQHKEVTRKCPGCGVKKAYPERNTYCGKECADNSRRLFKSSSIPIEEEYKVKRENSKLKAELREVLETSETIRQYNSFINGLLALPQPQAPTWIVSPKTGSKRVMPTAFLSDTHFGETVFPEQIEYLNAYNREIAEARLKNFFLNTAELAHDFLKGVTYDGIVLALGGDIFSGDIHEELVKTNAGPIQEEILYWIEPMLAGIRFLADEFGKVFIPSVVGNHPRGTMKPSHKMRVPNNFDWLFSHLLAKFLKHDKRITFQISTSADLNYSLYDTKYRLSHGDQFRGGSGIASLLSPIMIGDARKRKRSQVANRPYDWLLLGHWHQRSKFKNIMINGSLVGYNEYAYHANFDFEPPQQSFWITSPNHGVTIDAPIHVLGEDEPWLKQNPSIGKFV